MGDAKVVPIDDSKPEDDTGIFDAVFPGAGAPADNDLPLGPGALPADPQPPQPRTSAASRRTSKDKMVDLAHMILNRPAPRNSQPDKMDIEKELAMLGKTHRGSVMDADDVMPGSAPRTLESHPSFLTKVFGKPPDMPDFEEEHRRQSITGRIFQRKRALDPRSTKRWCWDTLIVCLIVYNFLLIPSRIAFTPTDSSGLMWFAADVLVDLAFLIDTVVHLNTARDLNNDGLLEWDATKVRYDWFYEFAFKVDIFCTLPLEVFILLPGMDSSVSGRHRLYLRFNKLLKITRLNRLLLHVNRWEDSSQFATSAFRMGHTMVFFFLFAHISACVQFFASDLQDHPPESWVSRTDIADATRTTQYTQSLFNALSHMLCIGYGRVPPETNSEVWIVIVSMMSGASFYVVLLGMMSSFMTSSDQSSAQYRQHMGTWKEYCEYRNVPRVLRTRIMRSLASRYHSQKVFDEQSLLGELPAGVRTDLQMHMCKGLIPKVPLFKSVGKEALATLVSMLLPQNYAEGELVYAYGDISSAMFFIEKGEVEIVLPGGELFTTLCEGSYFGEFFLFGNRQTRTGSARAATDCTLYALSGTDFNRAAAVYPEIRTNLAPLANARYEIYDDTGRRASVAPAVKRHQTMTHAQNNVKVIRARLDGTYVDTDGRIVPDHEVEEIKRVEAENLRKSVSDWVPSEHGHSGTSEPPSTNARRGHVPSHLAPVAGDGKLASSSPSLQLHPRDPPEVDPPEVPLVPVPPAEPRAPSQHEAELSKLIQSVAPAIGLDRAESFRDGDTVKALVGKAPASGRPLKSSTRKGINVTGGDRGSEPATPMSPPALAGLRGAEMQLAGADPFTPRVGQGGGLGDPPPPEDNGDGPEWADYPFG
mmetsp:Transcript_53239/g.169053  ORF Transcript_53239/g.169053 Transcript_53239/m.169053 type:complete len:873 (-) Transcript_53239:10-2628(-)